MGGRKQLREQCIVGGRKHRREWYIEVDRMEAHIDIWEQCIVGGRHHARERYMWMAGLGRTYTPGWGGGGYGRSVWQHFKL